MPGRFSGEKSPMSSSESAPKGFSAPQGGKESDFLFFLLLTIYIFFMHQKILNPVSDLFSPVSGGFIR